MGTTIFTSIVCVAALSVLQPHPSSYACTMVSSEKLLTRCVYKFCFVSLVVVNNEEPNFPVSIASCAPLKSAERSDEVNIYMVLSSFSVPRREERSHGHSVDLLTVNVHLVRSQLLSACRPKKPAQLKKSGMYIFRSCSLFCFVSGSVFRN